MVFENLTLFEIRLNDAQFGPRSWGRDESSDDVETDAAAASGRRRMVPFVAFMIVTAGLAVLWRRSRAGEEEYTIEDVDEADITAAQ